MIEVSETSTTSAVECSDGCRRNRSFDASRYESDDAGSCNARGSANYRAVEDVDDFPCGRNSKTESGGSENDHSRHRPKQDGRKD